MTDAPKTKPRPDPGQVVAVIRRILSENGREYFWSYAFAIVCLVSIAASTAFSAWIMKDVVDQIFYQRRSDLIVVICLLVFGAFAVRGAASYGQAVILAKVGNNLVARYQQRVFDHLMRLGLDFHTEQRSAQLAARINENVTGIRDLLGLTLTSMARDVVTLISLVAVMVLQDATLAIFAFVIGPPLVYAVNKLMRRMRRITRDSVEVNSRLIGAMQEAVQGIAVVKAFNMESQLSAKIAALVADAERRSNKIARVSERLTPVTELLAGFAVASVIAYAGYRSAYSEQMPGAVFSFISALLLAYDPARRLAKAQVGLERSLVNARMIYEILDLQPRQGDRPGARPLSVEAGEIRFEDVRFRYTSDLPVLHGVSFVAEAGKTTAIVGASGAGKSTLTALLERFYDVEGGRILIDGQDIAQVTKSSLRGAIAFVSQQPYLFEGTIRDNIRYGREGATDAEVEAAARLAAADAFIREQPDGYDTLVGENGVTLSGGQRQRLSIARAVLRDARILLLDEATSSLDTESEARVQEAIASAMRGRTVLVIAHRLSTVVSADKIVVMDQGRVVEQGTHRKLLADPNGLYARFYRLQDTKALGVTADDSEPTPRRPAPARQPRGSAA